MCKATLWCKSGLVERIVHEWCFKAGLPKKIWLDRVELFFRAIVDAKSSS